MTKTGRQMLSRNAASNAKRRSASSISKWTRREAADGTWTVLQDGRPVFYGLSAAKAAWLVRC